MLNRLKLAFMTCTLLVMLMLVWPAAAHEVVLPPIEVDHGGPVPAVEVEVLQDPISGWNARIDLQNFTTSPAHAGGDISNNNEGLVYLFVDGKRAGRLYGEWFHLGKLDPGTYEIAAVLVANNTSQLTYNDAPILDTFELVVPGEATTTTADDSMPHDHSLAMVMGEGAMMAPVEVGMKKGAPTLEIALTPDPLGGWNIMLETENFTFAPEYAGYTHIEGEGHAHLYVDGVKVARMYDEAYYLEGYNLPDHEITVVLNANDHAPLAIDGEIVSASATIYQNTGDVAQNMTLLGHVPLEAMSGNGPMSCSGTTTERETTYAIRDGKGHMAAAVEGNDVWGWTDSQNGHEYALVGLTNGTAFVDVTTPSAPVYLGHLPTQTCSSAWRDIKVYSDHAFVVADAAGSHGMQVFDLTRLRGLTAPQIFTADTVYTQAGSVHNLAINEDTGYAYLVGDNFTAGGAMHIVDIRDPQNPTFVNTLNALLSYDTRPYTHDAQVVTYNGPDQDYVGREIAVNADESVIRIVDLTDKMNPVLIYEIFEADVPNYDSYYVHQGWLTEDHRYYISNDEVDELYGGENTKTFVWDFTDLDNPTLLNTYVHAGDNIDHNLYTHNGLVFQSNYTAGLRVLDASDIANGNLVEIAYYDTYPQNDATTFNGTWSNYPYFASETILVNDIDSGLYLVRLEEPGNAITQPLLTNLEQSQLDTVPVLPIFQWTQNSIDDSGQVPAQWYRLIVGDGVADAWFPAYDDIGVQHNMTGICDGTTCTVNSADVLPSWGLLDGDYSWTVEAYYANSDEVIPNPQAPTFSVDVPNALLPANITVDPAQGHPTLSFADDPNTLFVQVYMGASEYGDLVEWYQRDEDFTCDGTTCSIETLFAAPADGGPYQVWMQAWGPGGLSTGGTDGLSAPSWVRGPDFSLPSGDTGLPTNVTFSGDALTWTSGANATYYEVYITTMDYSEVFSLGWSSDIALGCNALGATCTLPLDVNLVDGTAYKIYIQTWGPNGLATGGMADAPSYIEAEATYTP